MDPVMANLDLDDVLNKKLSKIERKASISPNHKQKALETTKTALRTSIANKLLENSVTGRIKGQLKEMLQ
jgi:hypothetical protein